MATPQRKLHSLEGVVAACALFFVLAISVGFAQADSGKSVFLRSSSALVQYVETGDVVIDKNSEAVVPIASITKLMTAMVILDGGLDLQQRIVLSREDIDSVKVTRSRLRTGTALTRDELLMVALWPPRTAPPRRSAVPQQGAGFRHRDECRRDARHDDSHFNEPTGLSPQTRQRPRPGCRSARRTPTPYRQIPRAARRVMSSPRTLNFVTTNALNAAPTGRLTSLRLAISARPAAAL
jgi:D-alanyl-D-alanine endopeptidase (penicillin-binding protein 7)